MRHLLFLTLPRERMRLKQLLLRLRQKSSIFLRRPSTVPKKSSSSSPTQEGKIFPTGSKMPSIHKQITLAFQELLKWVIKPTSNKKRYSSQFGSRMTHLMSGSKRIWSRKNTIGNCLLKLKRTSKWQINCQLDKRIQPFPNG